MTPVLPRRAPRFAGSAGNRAARPASRGKRELRRTEPTARLVPHRNELGGELVDPDWRRSQIAKQKPEASARSPGRKLIFRSILGRGRRQVATGHLGLVGTQFRASCAALLVPERAKVTRSVDQR